MGHFHPEGADVGYRWFAKTGAATLFPFGFGLCYTHFEYARLEVSGGETITASFDVKNAGAVGGTDTPQVYATVTGSDGKPSQRLIGWARVALEPGETRRVTVTADARLLANYDAKLPGWKIAAAPVAVSLATSAQDTILHGTADLTARTMKP